MIIFFFQCKRKRTIHKGLRTELKLTENDMQERRKKIILTAFHLFCERGVEDVPLTEIAKEANVGESTIYRYFDNKSNLVMEAFIKLWDLIMSEVEQTVENTDNYASLSGFCQIQVWIESFRQLYLNNSDFILFSYEAKLYLLRHKIRLNQCQQDLLMHAIKGPCLAALEKGMKDGSIPIKENSEDIFYAMWGSIRGYIVKIVIYGQLYGENSPWESRYQTMENGILSALCSGWEPLKKD